MRPPVRVLVPLLAAALLLSGCDAPASTPRPTAATEEVRLSAVPGVAVDRVTLPDANPTVAGLVPGLSGAGLTSYLAQQIAWSDCGEGDQCATILVPLDYAEPSAQALTLALRRKPATKTPRLGTLFVNPGGPGAAGTGLVDSFETKGLEQYDLVGWDPRGTGGSTPVTCFDAGRTDAFNDLDLSPDTDAERTALVTATYEFAASCWQHSGVLLEHISTIETVRDLDLMRRLLGDSRLHYFGYSYGTQIGATYAELFPRETGRLVLDAAVDISGTDDVIQAQGFELALNHYAQWCAEGACGLGGSTQAVLDAVTGLLDRLDGSPLPVAGRTLTQSLAIAGVAQMLYFGKQGWPTLTTMLKAAVAGNGKGLLAAADSLNARTNNGGYGTMFYAFPAISCLDSDRDKGILAADAQWQQDIAKAPIFGTYFGPQYTCALWPVRPARQLDLRGEGAEPLLVIGGTGDNATPYQQAVEMAKQLDSATLVTYEGEGHGSYGSKSTCINRIVVNYLVDGTVPADGLRCT